MTNSNKTPTEQPQKLFLKNYTPPTFEILKTELFFNLFEDFTEVENQTHFKRLHPGKESGKELFLNGSDLDLVSIQMNNQDLSPLNYEISPKGLTLKNPPDEFTLETKVRLKPHENTRLEGLYRSQNMFITQCEAHGFQRITYFLDRPDSMTLFKVKIEADQKKYPLLLSNGNLIESKKLENGRHQAQWEDPFKKACYLFALFAGDCGVIKDHFITASGKNVSLEIYSPYGSESQCLHAMDSLKQSMKWDEERFGREYDLSRYMIVSTHDFNAGAMENKGLNIFNSKYILADPKTATDWDYFHIQSVVAHEYFHNWTGNRVTLRDWFHLSLKEGLTVFRDQEFSMDMSSRSLVRIDSVRSLRDRQFPEDAGPNAHPIRPESCYAVDNFYTSTIYEKGAEVIRMMQTMVGRPGFRKGMDLYFERFDGKAVIIEDFAQAIADANSIDFEQFKLWYSQAGTPMVNVSEHYDDQKKEYTLTLKQNTKPTPDQKEKKPFHIPLVLGLLTPEGQEIDLKDSPAVKNTEGQFILHLKEAHQEFKFRNILKKPILSLNRQFSAPIYLEMNRSKEELHFLFSKDSDEYNQWEAGQNLYTQSFLDSLNGKPVNTAWISSIETLLSHPKISSGMKSELISLPSDAYLLQRTDRLDSTGFHKARQLLKNTIGSNLKSHFFEIYKSLHGKNTDSRKPKDFEDRRLKNTALYYLATQPEFKDLAFEQFKTAQIMTDQLESLSILSSSQSPYKEKALTDFYEQWKSNTLVLNTWFSLQASSTDSDTFSKVIELWDHPLFDKKNPNKIYSLILRFSNNLVRFHDPKEDTYSFYADRILDIDAMNPQVAARVASGFNVLNKLSPELKTRAILQLERLKNNKLSPNTYEIVSKCLESQ
ncbi:MAG TPA: aminopeptidase N [Pseudobdellovibrionaceae bacterium]|nr:aminopeptidase N [Pseudobdellovibrionaceae bacterium]